MPFTGIGSTASNWLNNPVNTITNTLGRLTNPHIGALSANNSNFSNRGTFSIDSGTPLQSNFNVRLNNPNMDINSTYVSTGGGNPISYSDWAKNPSQYGGFLGSSLSLTDATGNQNFGSISQNPWISDNLGNIASGIQSAAGIWQAYNAWRNNQLIEEQLDFQKEATNRALANQAKMVNNHYLAQNNIALGMSDKLSEAQKARLRDDVKSWYVDGSAIG